MKINSIVYKMMIPLITVTIFVTGVTLFVTQTYLKEVVEDVFTELKVHHLKTVYHLKMDNIVSTIKRDGMKIANSIDVKNFLLSDAASNKKAVDSISKELAKIKEVDQLEHVYVADARSKNYFNEQGFVKVVDTDAKESQWFLKTLESNKKFLINIDSDILGTLNIWTDAIVEHENKKIGLAGCGMDISNIYDLALEGFDKESASVIILNNSDTILGSSIKSTIGGTPLVKSNLVDEKITAIQEAKTNKKKLSSYKVKDRNRFVLLIPYDELNITIVVDFSRDIFLNSLHGIYNRIVVGISILLLLLLLGGVLTFTYLVSKPLSRVAQAVDDFDYKTDFELKNNKHMGYEIDMIYSAFNKNAKILKKLLDDYKNNEELLRSIMNSADDMIFYKDIHSRYIGCNNAYAKWSLKTIDEIVGKSDKDLYSPDVAGKHIRSDNIVINEERTVFIEERLKKENGDFAILQIKKSPFYDKKDDVAGIVVVARDVTSQKNMEQELKELNTVLEEKVNEKTYQLQESNDLLKENVENLKDLNNKLAKSKEEAQQAAQARSNFISSISHELRTPLNSIINFSDQIIEDFDEMLEDKELQADTQIYLNRVIGNSRHLLQLINDLLEFTKAEVGKIDYNLEQNDINEILKLAYSNTFSLLNGTDIAFNLSLYEKRLMGIVDARRFLQILLNLLSNSIKFTNKGSIKLRSFLENERIIVEIEDTGKGIPKEKHQMVFDPFIQVKSTDQGTGLGLGLAKKMCDDMGIEISFSSVEGIGTTFRLVVKNT